MDRLSCTLCHLIFRSTKGSAPSQAFRVLNWNEWTVIRWSLEGKEMKKNKNAISLCQYHWTLVS